jgi:hypothetical protein
MNAMLQNRPIALTLIAAALMLGGLEAIIDIVGALSFGRLNLNLAFLLLPAGIGLLRLSDGWRKFTLCCVGLAAAIVVGLAVYEAVRPGHMPVTWFGVRTQGVPRYLVFLSLVGIAGFLLYWSYRTLTCDEIKRLFAKEGSSQSPEPIPRPRNGSS